MSGSVSRTKKARLATANRDAKKDSGALLRRVARHCNRIAAFCDCACARA
jgi:hypothetical protein